MSSRLCFLLRDVDRRTLVGPQQGVERVEASHPEGALALHPGRGCFQGPWIEGQEMFPAGTPAADQARARSSTRMCLEIALRDIANGWATAVTRASPRGESLQDGAASGSASANNVRSRLTGIGRARITQPFG